MEDQNNQKLACVRFSKVGKLYHFECSKIADLELGDFVLVETSRGSQIGTVERFAELSEVEDLSSLKAIDRKATAQDLLIQQGWLDKQDEALALVKTKAEQEQVANVKFISAGYSFEGKRLTVLYSSDSDEKVDLKRFRNSIARQFAPSQLEMRQIGPRDVAKIVCGMGACGLEQRCCCKFLTDFNSISIKMAKEQNVSLTPTEITGICGRLRCCLIYEFEQYVALRKQLPKRNKTVKTPMGEGRVVEVLTLKEAVIVELPENGRKEFQLSEISFE